MSKRLRAARLEAKRVARIALLLGLPALVAAPARAGPAPASAVSLEARVSDEAALTPAELDAVVAAFDDELSRVDPRNGLSLYVGQQRLTPLVHALFTLGEDRHRLHVLEQIQRLLAGLPTLDDVAPGGAVQAVARSLDGAGPLGMRVRQSLLPLDQSFDNLPIPTGPAGRRRVFPMHQGDRLLIQTGNAQQFAYLLSTTLRLAAAARPAQQPARYDAALRDLYVFLIDDTLRFYWQEAPAWHWLAPFPNMRARALARLDGAPGMERRRFFRAFIDYELHIFAVAADLRAAARHRPDLVRSAADRALIEDATAIGWRVLSERIDLGPDGAGFAFDRGWWGDNPASAYADCTAPEPPTAECPRAQIVQDVSHAHRWPLWLQSFHAGYAEPGRRARIERWRRNLARQIGAQVLSFDAQGRPRMSNFIDGHDGWYLFNPDAPSGHRPGSLTGWSMRLGTWALLARLDPRLARGYRSFCWVVASPLPTDRAFRTHWYGSPSSDRDSAFAPRIDEYGEQSFYNLPCWLYGALNLLP